MLTFTSIITRSILAVATVGCLAVLADGVVRFEHERAVRGNLIFVGRVPAPVRVIQAAECYVAKGFDKSQVGATVRTTHNS